MELYEWRFLSLDINVALTSSPDSFSNSPSTMSFSAKSDANHYSSMLFIHKSVGANITASDSWDKEIQGE